ncbi:ABC transporter permease [Hymenobacter sp. 5516J-16]|uniref:ABC transporter permease n=1 Tax=Hymenobacter sublimis TaxID=2933777 RepID=A0ABY4JDS2_9BACT|nr:MULTISPECIES: ABC transporter permease [Hymenobacter]UOQ76890.1 ABC transporter permease [Hymenobacter sp. 5516J-16]UPL50581.1 ABC transporter permease [Hymenobacter sublimis]
MFRHLFKLIWNRKRNNALLVSEIFFSFVVLFGVGTMLITFGANFLSPHGFDSQQVWRLEIRAGQNETMPRAELDEVLRQVKALPGIRHVALTSGNVPFTFSTNTSEFAYQGRKSGQSNIYDADDRYAQALGLQLREGRWFEKADDGSHYRPVVISQDLREKLFGPEPALGKVFSWVEPGPNPKPEDEFLVTGVVENVRMENDFSAPVPSMWKRLLPFDTTRWETANVVVRVAPGAGGELQEKIARTVAGVTRQWTTMVRVMEDDRLHKRRYTLVPVVGLALVSVFLIVNVALGLFGVLWYNISQRRAEIGLRRAMGATGAAISWQFLGEMLVVTTLGVVLGCLLAAQFPLLGAFSLAPALYLAGMGVAAVAVYLITALCALYPSRLAAAIHPAVALREE